MLKNYMLVAFRNLRRNKTFTIINIAGLATGLAVFLLIFEFVAFEWGANRFHKNYDQFYRVALNNKQNGANIFLPPGYAPLMKEKFPGIEAAARVTDNIGSGVISYTPRSGVADAEIKVFREEQILFVEGNFLEKFTFPVIDGNPSLAQPATMAISESMAKKIFGETKAAGRVVTVSNQFGNISYTINAVYKDMPVQSDIKSDVLLSLHTLENPANRDGNDWADPNGTESGFVNIYLLLKENVNSAAISKQLTDFLHSVSPDSKDDVVMIQPLSELHLAPSFDYSLPTFGSLRMVVLLFAVAALILLIAWVNYINLSTVQALRRAKETGVRKVLGASRRQLTIQFLSETFVLTLSSSCIALVLVYFFQNLFNEFAGKPLSLQQLNQGWFWASAVILVMLGSLLSGGYVAFVLSSFKPVAAIRGKIGNSVRGISLRKGLVIFQFTISIVFIIATIVLYRQLQYMKTADTGLNLDQLLVIKGPTVSTDEQAERNVAFKNTLSQMPFVKKFAASNNVPGRGYNFSTDGITRLNPVKGDEKKSYRMFICDNNYFDTYNIKFAQGGSFTQNEAYDGWYKSGKIIINEKAAQQLGFPKNENLVGQKIKWEKEYEIVGVIKDYHHLSLQQSIEPMIVLPSVSFVYFTVQTELSGMQDKLNTISKLYKQYFPGNPFDYFFADETFNKQYQAEQKLGSVFMTSALVAILIACLGLFGLAAYTTQQRTKEVGIRKVLGASAKQITQLLSKDFVKLVIVAFCIASPVAWWAMNKWLQDFAYRTDISWWMFLLAAAIALLIAFFTVSFQAIKAAVANPVDSLRNE